MKPIYLSPLLAFFLLTPCYGNASSILRITCAGDNLGAEITVNGVFKGECPLEVKVNAGTIKLGAIKKVDARHERAFEQEIRLGDEVVKTIDIALSTPRLSAQAQVGEAARASAEAGDSAAMTAMGTRYATGNGVTKSDEQAVLWYRKAAEAGDAHAAYLLGFHYETGRGVQKNLREANSWYQKSAAGHSPAGLAAVGEWAFNGTGGTKDQALAVEAWREAAKAGSGQAMNGLATAYLQGAGGVQKDEAQALEWLKKAAAADYPRALVTLSERYRDGNGVTRDVEKHVELLNRAIDLGSPSAPARLGYAYAQGIGVPQDLVKAGALYRKSADLGDPWGMYALGLYSFYGRGGVQKNAQEGIALLEKAAALGLESAKTTLARPEFSSEKTRLAAATPARAESRFSISADGQEVTDNKTRLVWRRCAEGMKAAGPVCEGSPRKFTHADAAKHAAAEASRSGKNWRLPEINDELGTIWDLAFKPPFNPSAFPSTPQGHFWSSTKNTAMSDGSCSWVFDFHESEGYGAAAGCSPNNATHLVRLVRTAP